MKKQLMYFPIVLAFAFGLTACAGGYDSGYSYSAVTHYETAPSTVIVDDDGSRYYWRHRHIHPRDPHVVVHGGGSRPHYGPPPSSSGSRPHYGPPGGSSGSDPHYGPPSKGPHPHYGSSQEDEPTSSSGSKVLVH